MVSQRMHNLQSNLVDKMKSMIERIPVDIAGNQNSPSMLNINSKPISPPQPPSYSDAATEGLNNKVKSTIIEEMSRKRVTDTSICTVAIYGLPERKNDLKDVYSLFRSYRYNATVISYKRFGRLTPNQ